MERNHESRNVQTGGMSYLDMSLDLRPQLLQMLDYGRIDSSSKVCVLIGYSPCLVSDAIVNVLETTFSQKLIPGSEWYLDDPA